MRRTKGHIRVLCVDDNNLLGEALGINLHLTGGFRWLGSLENADDLVRVAQRCKPDVVLLDIDMPGKDPFEALEELHKAVPKARVLMLSGLVRSDLIQRSIDAGAWGYLSKNDAVEVIAAIERVAHGEFVMGPEVEATLLAR
jgi:two-component system, NarL family, response regulator DesR